MAMLENNNVRSPFGLRTNVIRMSKKAAECTAVAAFFAGYEYDKF
jgi:hypothetical protein